MIILAALALFFVLVIPAVLRAIAQERKEQMSIEQCSEAIKRTQERVRNGNLPLVEDTDTWEVNGNEKSA